ncbi:myosin-4-like isoform X3 [Cucurbita pepo subsp. pepo]|nr:myosin-4-like isoform X3 [Cucurbita pepo subsp. pepo]
MIREQLKGSNVMALNENQKLFLSLINEYAAEKSQGEQSVVVLKKRTEELRSELEVANVELENVKRVKETTEQELKGCEVELSLNETAIQTLEARISVLQGEIASVGSELDSLKVEGGATRDQFINHLLDLNKKIRKFQDQLSRKNAIESVGNATEGSHELEGDNTTTSSQSIEERLIKVMTQLANEEEEFLSAEQIQSQNRQTLINLEKRKAVMVMMVKGTKELEDLTKQTSGLEMSYGRLSEELLKSCICPQCFQDNTEALDNIPQ